MIRLEEIEKIPLIDTHMHRVHPARAPEWGSLGGGYIPGPGQERHGRQTVLYGMILEKLRQRFGMAEDASPEEVERERFLRYGKDPKGYYADLIGECNVAMHCVETGSPIGGPLYSQEEKAFFGASIPEEKQANIVRIDRVIDGLTPEGETFEQYTRRFLAELDREIRDQKAVGLKSCAAYSEGGLDVRPVEGGEAGQAYDRLRAGSARAGDERILRSWLLMESLQAAEEKDLPVQFHTGHGGGSWIDFPTMNPLCLVELLKDRRVMNRVRIVLLHGGHPHEEDTSYLTAQFANVYTDFSGAFYLSSLKGVERMAALLERAPLDKVMYGSDGVMFPEISWFAHGRFRVQLTRLLNRMTVQDNVIVGMHTRTKGNIFSGVFFTKKEKEERASCVREADTILRLLGLYEDRFEMGTSLPYGSQRKLEIARALATRPKLLLLDEPAAGMNEQETEELRQIVYRLKEMGYTILLIEHDMKFVMNICERIYVLNNGCMISSGTPDEVRTDPVVIEAYLGKEE